MKKFKTAAAAIAASHAINIAYVVDYADAAAVSVAAVAVSVAAVAAVAADADVITDVAAVAAVAGAAAAVDVCKLKGMLLNSFLSYCCGSSVNENKTKKYLIKDACLIKNIAKHWNLYKLMNSVQK